LPAEDGPDGGAGEAMEVGQLDSVVHWLGVLGVAVFAASGALEASRRQMDVVGFALVATVTGVGGGTLRDLLLGLSPVFWVEAPGYVLLCAAVAVLVFFTAHLVESRFKVLLWADALGLALFCATGAERALAAGASGVVAVMMGVMTATVGGIARDVLCAQVPLILRRELYATAAAAGAGVYVLLHAAGAPRPATTAAAFLAAFAIRALGLVSGWSFPAYKARPGRSYDGRG
jgi:uncharacterized membrane protein YeiH